MSIKIYASTFKIAKEYSQWGFSIWGYNLKPKRTTLDIYFGKKVFIFILSKRS